jgi:hypothetical protein
MKVCCTLLKNGYCTESDIIDKKYLKDYFMGSFRHHLGRLPSIRQIKTYLSGCAVVVLSGNLQLNWQGTTL